MQPPGGEWQIWGVDSLFDYLARTDAPQEITDQVVGFIYSLLTNPHVDTAVPVPGFAEGVVTTYAPGTDVWVTWLPYDPYHVIVLGRIEDATEVSAFE
jgi:hypothetical protein